MRGSRYFARSYHFVAGVSTTVRLGSSQPVVLGHNSDSIEEIEPHPEVIERRRELGLDYGKIDYVLHEGAVVILDVNKTTGAGGVSDDPKVIELRRRRARGIYSLLPGERRELEFEGALEGARRGSDPSSGRSRLLPLRRRRATQDVGRVRGHHARL